MKKHLDTQRPSRRLRSLLGPALALCMGLSAETLISNSAMADEASGKLVMLNWWGGSDLDVILALEKAFTAHNPKVTFENVALTGQGDMRGAIRTALLGGQKADLMIDAWPAFRDELAKAGLLRDLTPLWTSGKFAESYSDAFKVLGTSKDGKLYGITFDYGDRSGMYYRPDTLAKVGVPVPKTWDDVMASIPKFKAANVVPVALPAQYWAHAEWFETLLLRTAGVDFETKLALHQVPWTSPEVKAALKKFAELIKAGGIGDANVALATDADPAADRVLKEGSYGYELIGMWINSRAKSVLKLKEGTDYGLLQFPALGMGFDDTSMVNTDDWHELASGENKPAADAFLVWYASQEAANIVAGSGKAPASNKVDTTLFGPVQQTAIAAVSKSKLQFVLGDLLPGDLVDEYRVQLQKFIKDPSDANIDAVTTAIEAKAKSAYK